MLRQPALAAHHRLLAVRVEDTVHYSYLHLDLPDGLTTVSGTFGAGKSTLGLLICYALNVPFPPALEKKILGHIAGRLGNGKVTVWTRSQHGVELTVSRTLHQPPVVTDAHGNVVEGGLDGEAFAMDAYQQRELEDIAMTASTLFKLIDGFAAAETRQASVAIDDTLRLLARNAAELRKLDGELAGAEEQAKELPSVEAALLAVVAPPAAAATDEAEAAAAATKAAEAPVDVQAAHGAKVMRGKETVALTRLAQETTATRGVIETASRDALRRLTSAIEAAHETGPNGALFVQAHARARGLAAVVESMAARLRAEAEATEAALAEVGRALANAHGEADESYRKLMVRLAEDRGRAEERERLQRRVVELHAIAKHVAERSAEREIRRTERRSLLARLAAARGALLEVRRRIASELNAQLADAVSIDIDTGADTRAAVAMLGEVLAKLKLHATTVATLATSLPFEELVEAARTNDVERLVAVDRLKTGKVDRASNVLAELRASGQLYELETTALADMPRLRLRIAPGEDGLVDVATGSPGQRCTATLAVVILKRVGILFIDQPEDHVGAAYLGGVFAQALRAAQERRQIILITLAPIIPVLGDAKLVVFIEPQGKAGRLRSAGTVEAQREEIELSLDGGREAFLKRATTYGHELRARDERPIPATVMAEAE